MTRRISAIAVLALCVLARPSLAHDYPTEAIGDYLFACMAANGQTQDALKKCACSIDVISSIISPGSASPMHFAMPSRAATYLLPNAKSNA